MNEDGWAGTGDYRKFETRDDLEFFLRASRLEDAGERWERDQRMELVLWRYE